MVKIPDGHKWAAVTFHRYETRRIVVQSSGITEEYNMGMMLFSCDCGKSWETPTNEFAGRRVVLDCGCGTGKNERRAILSVNVPVRLLDVLDECAKAKTRGNRSEAVVAMLEAGLGRWSGGGEL